MAIARNKTALEFETMLRRHLKSGGAPVAACAGFDFDAASAYLENALGESHRAGFESHLAGCATCRCHLIELARLAQTAPRAGTQPATVADQTPARNRWRGVAAGWFDLSSWNFKWQMAGVAGAAFAILIAALGVLSWRQAPEQSNLAAQVNTETGATMAAPVPSPTPEASPQDQSSNASAESAASQPTQSRIPVPTPPVVLSPVDVPLSITPSTESPKLDQNPQSVQVPPDFISRPDQIAGALRYRGPTQQGQSLRQTAAAPFVDIAENDSKQARSDSGGLEKQESEDSARPSRRNITPPGINPVNTGPLEIKIRPQGHDGRTDPTGPNTNKTPDPESPGKTQTDKPSSLLSDSLAVLAKIINPLPPTKLNPKDARTLVAGNKPAPKSESSKERAKAKPADDESSKPLKHRIRDKVFVFRRDINMWIDEDYKAETMSFRQYRLIRGSKEYLDVLAKDPQLKEFFDHGPITIVWKNKVYRVK